MANKVVQLVDENNDNLYPLSSDPNAAHITMTTTDPGEGVALGQNEFVAVYGGSTKVGTSDIVDEAVTTAKIADNAVTNAKIDISLRTSASTIWTGNLYQTSSYIDLDEPLLQGNIYIFTVFGNSDSYLMEFPMTYRNPYFQCAYYDGTTVVRWRFAISNDGTRITLNNQSLNMSSNTALIRIAKVITAKQS